MAGVIRDDDFRIDRGRAADGKTYLRVVHAPTQLSRVVVGLSGRTCAEVEQELLWAVRQELETVGWHKPSQTPAADAEQKRQTG